MFAGKRKRVLAAVAAVVVLSGAGAYAWVRLAPRSTPAGQRPLVHLSQENFVAFSGAFDAAADRTRILALLSPT